MSTVRLALVGAGVIGQIHLKYMAQLGDGVLCAICDSDGQKARQTAQQLGVPWYTDFLKMLEYEKPDALIIATGHYSHYELTREALQRALPVLCEKPLTVSSTRAAELVELADQKKTILAVDFCMRMHPGFRAIRELCGSLGELRRGQLTDTTYFRTMAYYRSSAWRATWRGEGGGLLMNQAPHKLDLLYWFFGEPACVRADLRCVAHEIEVEDDCAIELTYANGSRISFYANTWEPGSREQYYFCGEKGALLFQEGRIKTLDFGDGVQNIIDTCAETAPAGISQWKEFGELTRHSFSQRGIAENFIAAIAGREKLIVSGKDALGSLRIANAALVSHVRGKEIPLSEFKGGEFDEILDDLIHGRRKLHDKK